MRGLVFLWLVLGCFRGGVLAAEKVLVKIEAPGTVEIRAGDRVRLAVVIEAGASRVSAVGLRLGYDEKKVEVIEVGVSGSAMTQMAAKAEKGVVALDGGVLDSKLLSGTINFGFISVLVKSSGKLEFGLKQMEVVGYGAGSDKVGVESEYLGVVAAGGGTADCRKAGLDLSGKDTGKSDGNVDLLDYSLVKTRALGRMKAGVGGALTADINGDCVENMADLGLVIREMILKMESI